MNYDSRQKEYNTSKIPEEINQRQYIKDQMDMFQNISDPKHSGQISNQNHLGEE